MAISTESPSTSDRRRGGDDAVDGHGAHVAMLLHDVGLRDEPELLAAVTAAAGIAIENAQLHAELRARVEELRARVLVSSRRARTSGSDSSATCTTALSSGWSRSRSS